MTWVDKQTEIFRIGIQKVYDKEIIDKNYLNSKDFDKCYDRMAAGIDDAVKQNKIIGAIDVCIHRTATHGENHSIEQSELEKQADSELMSIGPVPLDWWNL